MNDLLKQLQEVRRALAEGNIHAGMSLLDTVIASNEFDNPLQVAAVIRLQAYSGHVRSQAVQIKDAWANGAYHGEDQALSEAINEAATVSDSAFARDVLWYTENAAAIDEGALSWNLGVPWCELAYYALREDIAKYLDDNFGIDVTDPPPSEPMLQCPECSSWVPRSQIREDNCCPQCGVEI